MELLWNDIFPSNLDCDGNGYSEMGSRTWCNVYHNGNSYAVKLSFCVEICPWCSEVNLCWFIDWSSIDQSHRYGCPQAACREPAGSYDKTTRTAICFKHKTQYLLIRAPYTRIVVFWHISNIPPMILQSQISCNIPTFYIAVIFVKYCYTTGSWLLWLMS